LNERQERAFRKRNHEEISQDNGAHNSRILGVRDALPRGFDSEGCQGREEELLRVDLFLLCKRSPAGGQECDKEQALSQRLHGGIQACLRARSKSDRDGRRAGICELVLRYFHGEVRDGREKPLYRREEGPARLGVVQRLVLVRHRKGQGTVERFRGRKRRPGHDLVRPGPGLRGGVGILLPGGNRAAEAEDVGDS